MRSTDAARPATAETVNGPQTKGALADADNNRNSTRNTAKQDLTALIRVVRRSHPDSPIADALRSAITKRGQP